MLDYSETDEIFYIFAHFLAMLRPLSQNIMAKKKFVKTLRVALGVCTQLYATLGRRFN